MPHALFGSRQHNEKILTRLIVKCQARVPCNTRKGRGWGGGGVKGNIWRERPTERHRKRDRYRHTDTDR